MQLPDMKQFIFSTLAIVGLFTFISCEQHDWEDSADGTKDGTKNLFPKEDKKGTHGDHADEPKGAEGDSSDDGQKH